MTKRKLLTKISVAALALTVPLSLCALLPANNLSQSSAISSDLSYVSITNKNFDGISYDHSEGKVNGWSPKFGNVGAKMMIFDIAEGYTKNHSDIYFLKSNQNPMQMGADNKVLMINSANANPDSSLYSTTFLKDAYISDTITLDANSYYEFNVSIKTSSFDESGEFGSIYISGLKDELDNDITSLKAEKLSSKNWSTYYFFFSTGSKSQNITIDLWLGSESDSSTGVVFFDSVNGVKVSQNAYFEDYEFYTSQNKNVVIADPVSDRVFVDTKGYNFDFEDNSSSLVGWKAENRDNGQAEILDMNKDNFEMHTSFTYPGTDFSLNNKKSLVLYANDGYVSVCSKPLALRQFAVYKITAFVKVTDIEGSGGFTMTLRETNKIKQVFPGLENYEPMSATLSSPVVSNSSNTSINGYNEVTMYVKCHNRYDSEVEILLGFGNAETKATGAVVVDNITVEYVSSNEFPSTNSLELFTVKPDDAEIKNGFFNNGTEIAKNFEMPVKPDGFTFTDSGSKYDKQVGIINTYGPYFDSYSEVYDYAWAKNLANPGHPNKMFDTQYANNILMFYNAGNDYQSITSSTFTVGKETYRELSFFFRTYEETASINVKLLDSEGCILLSDLNLTSSEWQTYKCLIYGGEASTTMSLVIEFGNSSAPVLGHAFVDDIQIKDFDTKNVEADELKSLVDVDLSDLRINLDPNEEFSHNLSTSNAFTGAHESGPAKYSDGGIVSGKGNDVYQYKDAQGKVHFIDDGTLDGNVLVLFTKGVASYALSSRFTLSTEENNLYELSFRLLTSFPDFEGTHTHDDEDVPFGLDVSLEGFEAIKSLKSNDGWQTYTILFNSTQAKDAKLKFTLSSDCMISAGYVYITDVTWKISNTDQETFEKNQNFGKTMFVSSISSESEETPPDDDTDTEEGQNGGIDDSLWLLIPSIIMAVAVIVAVVGFSIRHIKFKKVEKARKEQYDRTDTLLQAAIENEAKQIQKAEIDAIEKDVASLTKELEELEEANKQVVAKSRETGKVTKEIEHEFKSYASKRGKIQKSIDELNEHKALVSSADYLIGIENRVRSQKKNEKTDK